MSNIIKSGRIRSQGYLDLSQRPDLMIKKVYEDTIREPEESIVSDVALELIEKRKEELTNELASIEEEIQKRIKEADNEIESLLSETNLKCENMKKEAENQKEMILAEATCKQAEIIQLAYAEAEQIKSSAIQEKQALLEGVEGEVVETMITLLQHLISEEIDKNVDWLRLVVKKMLLEDPMSDTFKLLVSPYNMQLIEKDKLHFMEGLSKIVEITSDETLNDTTCVVETSQGNIEYDISKGLEKMITEIRILKGIS